MTPESLFGIALGIAPPWLVEGIEFSKESKLQYMTLPRKSGDIRISFSMGRLQGHSIVHLSIENNALLKSYG